MRVCSIEDVFGWEPDPEPTEEECRWPVNWRLYMAGLDEYRQQCAAQAHHGRWRQSKLVFAGLPPALICDRCGWVEEVHDETT